MRWMLTWLGMSARPYTTARAAAEVMAAETAGLAATAAASAAQLVLPATHSATS